MSKVRNYITLFLGTLFSKGAGFLREILFSAWFGTGETAAAFRIAQTAYLLPVQALVGDTLSAGLLPFYKKLQEDNSNKRQILILCATLYSICLSIVITSILYLFSESISSFIAPNSGSGLLILASQFLKILALSVPFYILGGTLSFIETAYGYFTGVAIRPLLLNIFSILGVMLAVYFKYDYWLVILILISHIVFLIITIIKIRNIDVFFPKTEIKINAVKEVFASFFKNMFPLLGLPLIVQINVLCERIVSSNIGDTVIPAVDYARFLCDTTVQLIAVPLGIITMANFGGSINEKFNEYIKSSFTILLLVSVPIGLFFFQNSTEIIRIVFHRGAFGEESVLITSKAFQWMGLALIFTITAYFLIKVLNSMMLNKIAFLFTLLAVISSIFINFAFWKIFGVETIGLGVIAYSFTIFILCVFYLALTRKLIYLLLYILPFMMMQFLFCYYIDYFFNFNTYLNLFLKFFTICMLWYLTFIWIKEVRMFLSVVFNKIKYTK